MLRSVSMLATARYSQGNSHGVVDVVVVVVVVVDVVVVEVGV